jgi:hypothetical protein
VLALVLKLTLAPALVATATRVARHLGHRAAGMVSGLPVVAGPIALVLTVEQGEGYGEAAATAAVLGLVSLVLFCLAYAACARWGTVAALAAGWLAFGGATAALSVVDAPPLAVNAVVAAVAIGGGSWLLARASTEPVEVPQTGQLLVWRLLITAALVFGLTTAADGLSAQVAGLLTPFPIITAVLAGFTQAHAGAAAAVELLAGLTSALYCFLAFFVVLAATLTALGGVASFLLATAVALALWGALVALR